MNFRIYLALIALLYFFFNSPSSHAITNIGEWYKGAGSSSYLSKEAACQSFADYNTAANVDSFFSVYSISQSPTSFSKWECHLTMDGELLSNPSLTEVELVGWSDGPSAVRYRHDANDLVYDVMPYWIFGTKYKSTNPEAVCRSIVDNMSSTSYVYEYSHMEVYHVMRVTFTTSWFQCIATKRKIQKYDGRTNYPKGYIFVGTAKTSGYQEGSGGLPSPCSDSDLCNGGGGDGGTGGSGGSGGTGGSVDVDMSGVETRLSDLLIEQTDTNTNILSAKTELINIDTSIMDLKLELLESQSNQTKINESIKLTSDYQKQSVDLLENLENGNIKLQNVITDLEESNNNAFNKVVSEVSKSSVDQQLKLSIIETALNDLSTNNVNGYSDIVTALDGLKIDVDNAPTVTAINSLSTNVIDGDSNIVSSVNTNSNKISGKLDLINDQSVNNANAIIGAIGNIGSSNGNVEVDFSGLESSMGTLNETNSTILESLDSFSDVTKETKTEPNKNQISFWDSSYPNGLTGIWAEKEADFQQTSFINWLNSFKLQFNGSSAVPEWSMCFDLGIVDLGCNDILLDSRIWGAIRLFILITAAFLCRRLVFGG